MDILSVIAEQRIRDAAEEGLFENLPGAGRPLALEDDSHIPEDLRMAYKLLRNAGYAPPEIEDRKEAISILTFLKNCDDEQEKVRQMRKLDVVLSRIEAARGHPVTISDIDPYYGRVAEKIQISKKEPPADS